MVAGAMDLFFPALWLSAIPASLLLAWYSFKRESGIDDRMAEIAAAPDPSLPLKFRWRKSQAILHFTKWPLASICLLVFISWLLWSDMGNSLSMMLMVVAIIYWALKVQEIMPVLSKPAFIIERTGLFYAGKFVSWDETESIRFVLPSRSSARIVIAHRLPFPEGMPFTKAGSIDLPAACVRFPVDAVAYAQKAKAGSVLPLRD